MAALDRVLSAVLAFALLVGGLLVAVEIVVAGLGHGPWLVAHDRWAASARTTPWSDADLRLLLAGLVVVGALLVVVAGARRRPQGLPLAAGGEGVVSSLDRRTVERWLAGRVEGVDGVSSAGVRITNSSTSVEATSRGRDAGAVEPGVQAVADTSLASLNLDRVLRVRVKVRTRQDTR